MKMTEREHCEDVAANASGMRCNAYPSCKCGDVEVCIPSLADLIARERASLLARAEAAEAAYATVADAIAAESKSAEDLAAKARGLRGFAKEWERLHGEASRRWREATDELDSLRSKLAVAEARTLDIVFDGPPSHESGRFVEVEDSSGSSVNAGVWIDRGDGMWALRIPGGTEAIDRAERAEAAAGQMRAALEGLWKHLQDDGRDTQTKYLDLAKAVTFIPEALATDAGKGWVSPSAHAEALASLEKHIVARQDAAAAHAEVVRERDEARAHAKKLESSRLHWSDCAVHHVAGAACDMGCSETAADAIIATNARAEKAEQERDEARELVDAYKAATMLTDSSGDPDGITPAIAERDVLATRAALEKAEARVALLEPVVEAARGKSGTYREAWDALLAALAILDAAPTSGTRAPDRRSGLEFAIEEVEALRRTKQAVGCYSPAFLAAFDDVLATLKADLERGCQPSTSDLQGSGTRGAK